jgi:hypothetical protein
MNQNPEANAFSFLPTQQSEEGPSPPDRSTDVSIEALQQLIQDLQAKQTNLEKEKEVLLQTQQKLFTTQGCLKS